MGHLDRVKPLYDKQEITNIEHSKIIIFGIGGVGGFVAEMLVRSGLTSLTVVDYDVVEESNLNRQITALKTTIGDYKVDIIKKRLLDINSKAKITAIKKRYNKSNSDEFNLESYDYVIDCIDSLNQKIDLIIECKNKNINIISAMGAGNRRGVPSFKVSDIFATFNCGLAREVRVALKRRNIHQHVVVFSEQAQIKPKVKSSLVFYPASMATVIASYVVEQIAKGKILVYN